jgi:hypothetical protein
VSEAHHRGQQLHAVCARRSRVATRVESYYGDEMEIWELMAAGEYGTLKVLMVRVLEVWADVDRLALYLLVDWTRLCVVFWYKVQEF